MDYDHGDPVGAEIEEVMVASAITSTATIAVGDPYDPGAYVYLLEMRAFTLDGKEHHLLWPLEAALPLLGSIQHVALKHFDGPEVSQMQVPDDPSSINWDDETEGNI